MAKRRQAEMNKVLRAFDWGQYRLNGGSYCLAVMKDDRYCGRSEIWAGHNMEAGWPNHPFVPGCPSPVSENEQS